MLIYRIFNETHNYIGSTVNLKQRMAVHKCPTHQSPCSSKIIIESGNYEVEILEECEDKDRKIREQYYIDKYDCVNVKNPVRKKYWDNIEENKIYMKIWKKKNKEYKDSWGGDKRNNNNLLCIDIKCFY